MKISDLISEFTIFTSNEEKLILDRINEPCYVELFNEHERTVIENLIRKSLVTKIDYHGGVMVKRNEQS